MYCAFRPQPHIWMSLADIQVNWAKGDPELVSQLDITDPQTKFHPPQDPGPVSIPSTDSTPQGGIK